MGEKQPSHLYPCIKCPSSCEIAVVERNGEIAEVIGYSCKLGIAYARKEHTQPERNVTTTVRIHQAMIERLPVRTSVEVPKQMVRDVVRATADVDVTARIREGDVIVRGIGGTSADLIACRTMDHVSSSYSQRE